MVNDCYCDTKQVNLPKSTLPFNIVFFHSASADDYGSFCCLNLCVVSVEPSLITISWYQNFSSILWGYINKVVGNLMLAIYYSWIHLNQRALCCCSCECVLVSSSLCVFKRRSLTFILVFLSQTMGGYGREGRQRGVCMCGDAGLWNEVSSRGGFTHSWETRQRTAPVCLTYIQTHRGLTQKERRGKEGEGRKCWDGHVWTCLSASQRWGAGLHPGLWERQGEVQRWESALVL